MLSKVVNQGMKLSFLFAMLVGTVISDTLAYADEMFPPIFGDITISRQFSPDPVMVRGMSGGSLTAKQVVGRDETPTGPCTGFFDEKPDHTLELKSKFDYLKLQVESPEDTTIVVSGPGGSWCNDDFEGKNPGIVGEWLPGTYNIWIGSYKKEQYLPYTLEITEVE